MSIPLQVLVVGLSHKTAPVALRERLAFRAEDIPRVLARLREVAACREAAILSTCNRVELYAVAAASDAGLAARVRRFLAEDRGVGEHDMAPVLYEHRDAQAAGHLFEVTASLDSQILGETEILMQAREAYRLAAEAGGAGPVLRALFERSFFLSKELRTQGGIGAGQASVSSAAVKLAEKIFENLRKHSVLVVGAGTMASGIVRSLRGKGMENILIVSRTPARAEAFARQEGGRCGKFEDLAGHLETADIVLVSTAAPHYVIRPEHLDQAQAKRHGRPLFFIDISVPRNVDPQVHQRPDTFLYDIDDLEAVAREGHRKREAAAERWRPRLEQEAHRIMIKLCDASPDQTARELVKKVQELRLAELEALRASSSLDEETYRKLSRAFEHFQNQLLHGPLATLKEAARAGDGHTAAQWISRFFRLAAERGVPPGPETPAPLPERPGGADDHAETGTGAEPGKEIPPASAREDPVPRPSSVPRALDLGTKEA